LSVGGFASVTGGPTIGVTGNIYASNAVQTTNIFATGNVTATQFIGVNFTPVAGGPTIGVTGNVYTSNAVQTRNVYASNIADQTGSFGTLNQVLTKAAAGTLWAAGAGGTITSSTAGYVTYYSAATTVTGTSGLTYVGGGALTCSGDVVAYSDSRVKTDLKKIGEALEKLSKINGYTFNRTDDLFPKRYAGVIAQEVREVLPEVVYEQDDKLSVAYGNLTALLIEAIKELETRVSRLENL
jgi:hypothetical protein